MERVISIERKLRRRASSARALGTCAVLALAIVPAAARSELGNNTPGCDFNFASHGEARPAFPKIPICPFPGAYQDSTLGRPNRCGGQSHGQRADTVRGKPPPTP